MLATGILTTNQNSSAFAYADESSTVDTIEELSTTSSAAGDNGSDLRAVNSTALWAGQIDTLPYPPACMVETNLGDVAAESFMRAVADARKAGELPAEIADLPVVALERGGNLRGTLARGIVSLSDVDKVVAPASGMVDLVEVTPHMLHDVFEDVLATVVSQDPSTGMLEGVPSGDTPQLAGLVVMCDPNLSQGSRVTSMALESGSELDLADDATPILLATCDYALNGAYPYEALAGCELIAQLGDENAIIKAFLSDLMLVNGNAASTSAGEDGIVESDLGALPIIAGTKERLRFEGSFAPHDWDACVALTDEEGAPVPNTSVSVLVDGQTVLDLVSDADGFLGVPLTDGSHALALVSGQSHDGETTSPSFEVAGQNSLLAGTQTSSDRLDAAARALSDIATSASSTSSLPEIYVNNYVGLGLVEDDVRVFPKLMIPSDVQSEQ